MMSPNVRLVEGAKIVSALPPITPSTSTPAYVCLKGYERCAVIIHVDNGTPVTGSAITLKQNTSGTTSNEAALAFTAVWANTDTGASDALVETAVSNNTFTTSTGANKNLMYVIEVDCTDLDVANGKDWLRVGTGDGANMVLSALYILYPARYASSTPLTAIA